MPGAQAAKSAPKPAPKPTGGRIEALFHGLRPLLNDDRVRHTGAIYAFDVAGADGGRFYIDLKNGSGSVGSGDPPGAKPDVVVSMSDTDCAAVFSGKLSTMSAFLTGRIKIKGNMALAMRLEKLLNQIPRASL